MRCRVDLREMPLYWLTCEKSRDRWEGIESMLESLNLSTYSEQLIGKITTPYTIGVAMNHLEALRKTEPPFIIIEDDARYNSQYRNTIGEMSIPYNIDALYLGTSTYGRIYGGSHNGQVIAIDCGDYNRPINMLGVHAILYLSKRYITHIKELLENFIKNPIGGMDDRIAETMHYFDIRSLKVPLFYQNDGHSEQATLTPIRTIF